MGELLLEVERGAVAAAVVVMFVEAVVVEAAGVEVFQTLHSGVRPTSASLCLSSS